MAGDSGTHCYACTKVDKIVQIRLKQYSFFFSLLMDGSVGTSETWKFYIKIWPKENGNFQFSTFMTQRRKCVWLENGCVADGQFIESGEHGTFNWSAESLLGYSFGAYTQCMCSKKIDSNHLLTVALLGKLKWWSKSLNKLRKTIRFSILEIFKKKSCFSTFKASKIFNFIHSNLWVRSSTGGNTMTQSSSH